MDIPEYMKLDWITRKAILRRLKGRTHPVRQRDIVRSVHTLDASLAIGILVRQGIILRTGTGKKSDPYWIRLPIEAIQGPNI